MGGELTEKKKDEEIRFMKLDEIHTVKVVEKTKVVEIPKFRDVEVDRLVYTDVEVQRPIFKDVEVKRYVVKDEDITPLVEQAVKKMLAKFEAKLDKACSDMLLLMPKIETKVKASAEEAVRELINKTKLQIYADTKLKVE